MNADNIPLGELTDLDQTALDNLAARQEAMLERTIAWSKVNTGSYNTCLLYTSPSPRDGLLSRMPSSA